MNFHYHDEIFYFDWNWAWYVNFFEKFTTMMKFYQFDKSLLIWRKLITWMNIYHLDVHYQLWLKFIILMKLNQNAKISLIFKEKHYHSDETLFIKVINCHQSDNFVYQSLSFSQKSCIFIRIINFSKSDDSFE